MSTLLMPLYLLLQNPYRKSLGIGENGVQLKGGKRGRETRRKSEGKGLNFGKTGKIGGR